MASASSSSVTETGGGYRIFSGESEDYKEYRRWKLWIQNKLRTLDKLAPEHYGSYLFTCLSGKALEAVEHLECDSYQKVGGDQVLLNLLDKRFPEKEKSDELAEVLGEVFAIRAKEGENMRQWISRSVELFDRCKRKTGVVFPAEAQGWMILKHSGLPEEQQAVVKGRALGDLTVDAISKAMRSVYPDYVVRRRTGAALVEEAVDDEPTARGGEVQGFDDVELFLTDYIPEDEEVEEQFPEADVAEVLATTWKERRLEIAKLQKQRRFGDAKDLRRSFRVEIEELKKKTVCNRCGQRGHWARECRQKRDPMSSKKPSASSTNNSSGGKGSGRESGAGMVVAEASDEAHFIAAVDFPISLLDRMRMRAVTEEAVAAPSQEILLVSSPGFGVLDSGCGKTIIGEDTLKQFSDMLAATGVKLPGLRPETNLFRFGNGQVETSQNMIDLPVGLAGKRGVLQAAVVRGSAPLLVSRPALKKLGAAIDFANDELTLFQNKMKVPLEVNSAGQYIVNVMQFSQHVSSSPQPAESLLTQHVTCGDNGVGDSDNLGLMGLEPKVSQVSEDHVQLPSSGSVDCPRDECHSPPPEFEVQASHPIPSSKKAGGISKRQLRKLKTQVNHHSAKVGNKYAVVEVFSPPRVVPQVERMGLKGLSLDLKLGWDLTDPKTQAWVLDELRQHPPELLILCPPCTNAGGWFHLNKCFLSMSEYLAKKHTLRKHLKFCKALIKQQLSLGGRFIFEHPSGSEVWKDPDMLRWRDELTSFITDMCRFDLHLPAHGDKPKQLLRKSTRLLVSHSDMKQYLERRCPGDAKPEHQCHATVSGAHPKIGPVSVHAGKYTLKFVQAMIQSVPALRCEEVLLLEGSVHDTTDVHEVLVAEQAEVSDSTLESVIKRLHNNLGHPSKNELLRVLRHGQASDRALTVASRFKCDQCEAQQRPKPANPAQTSQVTVFNQKIGIDVKSLNGWKVNQKVKALNIVDYASNFQLMIPFFEVETSSLLRRLLNERWLAWTGPPRELIMDPARTNLGRALTEPCELEGTHVNMTAAGASWQLGKVEVHGGLFAQVLDRVLAERAPSTKEEWLDCVRHCHVKNATIQTHGFTPSQVVFGKNPDLPGELLNEPSNVVANTASLLEDSVEKAQAIRRSAKLAILELQDSKAMRRALSARPRAAKDFRAGDVVAYWRDQKWRDGVLSRGGRWFGSAIVLGHVGRNVVIAHRTHILRCAPEQLRMATDAEKALVETPETQLLGIKDMIENGTFRSAQYVDLLPQAYPSMEEAVVNQALEDMQSSPGSQVLESSPDANLPAPTTEPAMAAPGSNVEDSPVVDKSPAVSAEPTVFDDEVPIESPAEASAPSSVVPASNVDASDPSGSAPAGKPEASTYGPLRRTKVITKSGPLALHRPLPMQHDDFVEVIREVLPKMLDQAVGSHKREAAEPAEGSASKSARTSNATEQLSVQHIDMDDLSPDEVSELCSSLDSGVSHEVLIAQYLQKRMQKELPHSNHVPWLQSQVDAAKTLEWNTLAEKQAVRLLSPREAAWVRKNRSHRIMGSRFVLIKKALEDIVENGEKADPENPDHWKVKARWCLQGHLDPDLSCKAQAGLLQSPTLSQMGRMVLFQLLASKRWCMQLGDIKGAFLEAGPLDPQYRPLYARLPPGGLPGVSDECLVEVLGNVYGQNDAPASWYKVFDSEVLSTGFVRSKYDPCLYFLRDKHDQLCGILGSHVDDTVTGGQGPEYEAALSKLRQRFPYRKWRVGEGEFCGAHYRQCETTKAISMSQQTFAHNLKPVYLSTNRRAQRDSPLDPKEISILRAVNGSLNWLASQSRPDIAAQTSLSQQAMSKPQVHHLCEVNNVIRRAKQHAELAITFKPIAPDSLRLICHSDAAFANVGVYTQAGYVIGFCDSSMNEGKSADWTPIVWKSYKLPRAVGSTLSAEAQAMSSATGTLEWTSLLLAEALDGSFPVRDFEMMLKRRPPMVVTDCKSLYDHLISVSSPTSVDDRRTSIDIVIIRQSISRLAASIRWVPTNRMIADSLTKDAGDPTDLLRACIRLSNYQISPEETVLKMQADEKQRRLDKRKAISDTMSMSKASLTPLSREEHELLKSLIARSQLAMSSSPIQDPGDVASESSDWSVMQSLGAMSDGSKRRVSHSPEREVVSRGYCAVGHVEAPHTIVSGPPMTDLSHQALLGPPGNLGKTRRGTWIFLPPGVENLEAWGRCILDFGKYEQKGYIYQEMISSTDPEIMKYVKWCQGQVDHAEGCLKDFALFIVATRQGPDFHQQPVIPGTDRIRKSVALKPTLGCATVGEG
eukprot:s883_g4.t1